MDKKIEVQVTGLRLEEQSETPILILQELESSKVFPIWIGTFEAVSIAYAQENLPTSRPLTHELIITLIQKLNGKVKELYIFDVVDNAFHSNLIIETNENIIEIPCRPSDGVTIALRSNAKITIDSDLFFQNCIELIDDNEIEKFNEFINSIEPSDFA